ncbi:MAG TPA: LysE family translocator [Duganella sp.]|jgi:threonine/homoserine/homoserine lactone efflux protein
MDFGTWFAFFLASLVTAFLPGQAILLAVANSLEYGRRKALASSLGNAVGIVLLALATLAGLGLLLREHPLAFDAIKLCGALYLVWLGVSQWRAAGRTQPLAFASTTPGGGAGLFAQGVLVAITNPKSILFFAALFPQFVDAGQGMLPRFALMTATFAGCAVTAHVCFIAAAPWAASRLREGGAARAARRIGAVLFVAVGLGMLLLPRMG